jgi:hypothetical protein
VEYACPHLGEQLRAVSTAVLTVELPVAETEVESRAVPEVEDSGLARGYPTWGSFQARTDILENHRTYQIHRKPQYSPDR